MSESRIKCYICGEFLMIDKYIIDTKCSMEGYSDKKSIEIFCRCNNGCMVADLCFDKEHVSAALGEDGEISVSSWKY